MALLAATPSPVFATLIGVPGNMPTNLPQGSPNPELPGFNNYPFMLSNVIAGPSPNPLPNGLFNETPLQFNLVLIAGFGQAGRVDPVVAPQMFNFFIIGDFWSVQAQFEYAPNTGLFHPSDVVTMTGDAVHRIAPHPGEFAPGPAIPFNLVLNAGSTVTLRSGLMSGARCTMPAPIPMSCSASWPDRSRTPTIPSWATTLSFGSGEWAGSMRLRRSQALYCSPAPR